MSDLQGKITFRYAKCSLLSTDIGMNDTPCACPK